MPKTPRTTPKPAGAPQKGPLSPAQRLTKYQVAAMWLFGDEYALGTLSATDFWIALSPNRKNIVREMVAQILAAPFGTFNGLPSRPTREAPDGNK